MKPLIGITCYKQEVDRASKQYEGYYLGIEKAGGLPLLIPNMRESATVEHLYKRLDGVMLTGGEDIDPVYFNEEPHPKMGKMSPERDIIEVDLARWCLRDDKPILGICRGMQVLNVAAGGSLYQDIYAQIPDGKVINHNQKGSKQYPFHKVKLRPGSKLNEIFNKKEFRVNSSHHQAVRDVAGKFIVTAQAPDGIIEGIEGVNYKFALGVQWHPERMWRTQPDMLKIFEALVKAAKKK